MLIINEKNKNPIRCELNGDNLAMSCTTGLGKINDKISVKYSGEPITVISHLKGGCVVSIKDGRYNIDNQLAEAIII